MTCSKILHGPYFFNLFLQHIIRSLYFSSMTFSVLCPLARICQDSFTHMYHQVNFGCVLQLSAHVYLTQETLAYPERQNVLIISSQNTIYLTFSCSIFQSCNLTFSVMTIITLSPFITYSFHEGKGCACFCFSLYPKCLSHSKKSINTN